MSVEQIPHVISFNKYKSIVSFFIQYILHSMYLKEALARILTKKIICFGNW
jgi:hypothetical protein